MVEFFSGLFLWLGVGCFIVSLVLDAVISHHAALCRVQRFWHLLVAICIVLLGPVGIFPLAFFILWGE